LGEAPQLVDTQSVFAARPVRERARLIIRQRSLKGRWELGVRLFSCSARTGLEKLFDRLLFPVRLKITEQLPALPCNSSGAG